MPIASFAKKNDIYLSFTNGEGLFDKQTMVNAYKQIFHSTGGELPVYYHTYNHLGSSFVNASQRGENSRSAIESIKKSIKILINSNK